MVQVFCTRGQRGAKAHPAGRVKGVGGIPLIVGKRAGRGPFIGGIDVKSA